MRTATLKSRTLPLNNLSLAEDASTPEAVLVELSKSSDSQVLRALCSNPNTPLITLIEICHHNPEAVAQNRRLLDSVQADLLTLSLVERQSLCASFRLQDLACSKIMPFELARAFCYVSGGYHDGVEWDSAMSLANNPHCPPDVLGELCNVGSRYARMTAAKNPRTPQDVLLNIQTVCADRALYSAKPNEDCSAAEMTAATSLGGFAAALVLMNPNCPESLFTEIFDRTIGFEMSHFYWRDSVANRIIQLGNEHLRKFAPQIARISLNPPIRQALDDAYRIALAST